MVNHHFPIFSLFKWPGMGIFFPFSKTPAYTQNALVILVRRACRRSTLGPWGISRQQDTTKLFVFFLNLAIFFEFWCHYLFDPVKIGWNRFYSCQKYTIYAKIPRLPLGVTMRGGGKSPRNVDKPHIRSGYVHILGMIWQTKRSIVLAFFC